MIGSLPFLPLVGPSNVALSWVLIIPVQVVLNRLMRANDTDRLS